MDRSMENESRPGFTEAKHPSARVSLKEIANSFASPLTEEHAWAVLYQLTQRFMRHRENFERGITGNNPFRSNSNRAVINLESVLLSEDGGVEVKMIRKRQTWEGEDISGY